MWLLGECVMGSAESHIKYYRRLFWNFAYIQMCGIGLWLFSFDLFRRWRTYFHLISYVNRAICTLSLQIISMWKIKLSNLELFAAFAIPCRFGILKPLRRNIHSRFIQICKLDIDFCWPNWAVCSWPNWSHVHAASDFFSRLLFVA